MHKFAREIKIIHPRPRLCEMFLPRFPKILYYLKSKKLYLNIFKKKRKKNILFISIFLE